MKKSVLLLSLFAAITAGAAIAQDGSLETVMVTGTRVSDSDGGGGIPYVVVTRRADHLVTSITVEDDTRDAGLRTKEMRETLQAVIREAKRDSRISLSVQRDGILKDFTESLIDIYINPGNRPDTSRARILVKTPIKPDDTFDSTTGRIDSFVKRVPEIGRSQTRNDADWELTIVGPQQYHGVVVKRIAEKAKETAASFGPDYGVHIDGLHRPVQWYRAGQLDLALYIPYTMTIQPK